MTQQRISDTNENLRKLPGYVCMVCGATVKLAPVSRPMLPGESQPWWACRPGYGCALDNQDSAGML